MARKIQNSLHTARRRRQMAAASGGNIEVLSSDEVMAEGDKQEVLMGNVQGYMRKKIGPSRA